MTSRRTFLKSLGAAGLTSSFLPILSAKSSPDLPPGDDFKAIVCVYLYGGNDAFNMLVPSDSWLYNEYADARGGGENADSSIAVANNLLDLPDLSVTSLTNSTNPYSSHDNKSSGLKGVYDVGLDLNVNGVMPELAHLLRNQKVKLISNVGNLIEPLKKKDISNLNKKKPVFLFSHNDQRKQVDIGRSDLVQGFGWAGQIADKWFGAGRYEEYPFGLNLSLRAGGARLLEGMKTRPYNLNNYPKGFDYMRPNDKEKNHWGNDFQYNRRALYTYLYGGTPLDVKNFNYSKYNWESPVSPLDLSNRVPEYSSNYLRRFYQKVGLNSLKTTDTFLEVMKEDLTLDGDDSYGGSLFSIPGEETIGLSMGGKYKTLLDDFRAITKMIKLAKNDNYRRQIYLVKLGGFDTHSNQLNDHPALLRGLSLGLHQFNKAMEEMGLSDQVVTYTTSDFGRTVSNNGKGTDHGWGSHQLVMGGGINKSEVVGKLPSLVLGGDDDQKTQGRIIPSIANIQIQAELAHWFGAEKSFLPELFPHLSNFQTDGGDLSSAFVNLGLKS